MRNKPARAVLVKAYRAMHVCSWLAADGKLQFADLLFNNEITSMNAAQKELNQDSLIKIKVPLVSANKLADSVQSYQADDPPPVRIA